MCLLPQLAGRELGLCTSGSLLGGGGPEGCSLPAQLPASRESSGERRQERRLLQGIGAALACKFAPLLERCRRGSSAWRWEQERGFASVLGEREQRGFSSGSWAGSELPLPWSGRQ